MRKSLIGAMALGFAVVVGGGLWLVRRGTALPSSSEGEAPLFKAEPQGAGMLIQMEAREPLRAVRWLPPLAGGEVLCQVSTQSDRQLLALFPQGKAGALLALPRPEGLSEGFFRQMEVRDALRVKEDLVLLLKVDGGRRDLPLVMALDREGGLRWAQRILGDHLAAAEGSVWVWGPSSAQRLPLAATKVLPPAVTWPEEVPPPVAFLPVGSGFLLSHAKGLSAWRGEAGWTHTPRPAPSPLGFTEPDGTLLKAGTTLYWQPEPGALLRVSAEGQVLGAEALPTPEGAEREGALLRLLGRDAGGRLWFGLAAPLLPAASATPVPATPPVAPPPASASAEEGWKEEAAPVAAPPATPALTSEVREAYEALLKAPMDRLYAWKPGEKALRRIIWSQAWPQLHPPTAFAPPPGDGALRPEAGGFLFGTEGQRWWLPLDALR